MRCKYSEYGKECTRPAIPERHGDFLGYSQGYDNRTYARVRWDGITSVYKYHPDFIEMLDDNICTIDLSRAPVLRELLGWPPLPNADADHPSFETGEPCECRSGKID